MPARPTILLVEDDQNLGEALRAFLDIRGFDLIWFRAGSGALCWLERERADLCILDIMLPLVDGFEIARKLRNAHSRLPFIFLTARGLKPDRLKGFMLGADDYIVKPVDEDELVARIHVVLRRANGVALASSDTPIKIGRYSFVPSSFTLTLDTRRHVMTEREAALLALLCDNRGRLVRRDAVLQALWHRNDTYTRRSMDVFVYRLRRHLRHDPAVAITTVRGSGLILETEP